MAAGRTWHVCVCMCVCKREMAYAHSCERDRDREKETKTVIVVEYGSNAIATHIEKMSTYMYERDEW